MKNYQLYTNYLKTRIDNDRHKDLLNHLMMRRSEGEEAIKIKKSLVIQLKEVREKEYKENREPRQHKENKEPNKEAKNPNKEFKERIKHFNVSLKDEIK